MPVSPRLTLALFLTAVSGGLSGCLNQAQEDWTGYAEADIIYLASPTAGQLRNVAVQRGDMVKRDQALFALDTDSEDINSQAAQAQQDRASAQLTDLGKGRRPHEIQAVEAQLEQARAALVVSSAQLKRHQELVKQGFASPAQLDELQAAQSRDAALVRQAEAQLAVARDQARPDTIGAARAELRAAEAQLAQQQWVKRQKARAAPVNAQVFDVLYRVGEWVPAGAPVVALLPEHAVKVRFFVPQTDLARTKVGNRIQYACDGCQAATAVIRYVSPQAEFTPPVIYSNESRGKLVYMVEAIPEGDAGAMLKPGQPLTVHPAQQP